MEHGKHHLEGRLVHLLVHIHGDTTAVVHHAYAVVFEDSDFDMVGVAGEGFVYGVVHDLIDQMVQAAARDVSDVHRRAFAHGLQTFQHLDIVCLIMFRGLFGRILIFF